METDYKTLSPLPNASQSRGAGSPGYDTGHGRPWLLNSPAVGRPPRADEDHVPVPWGPGPSPSTRGQSCHPGIGGRLRFPFATCPSRGAIVAEKRLERVGPEPGCKSIALKMPAAVASSLMPLCGCWISDPEAGTGVSLVYAAEEGQRAERAFSPLDQPPTIP